MKGYILGLLVIIIYQNGFAQSDTGTIKTILDDKNLEIGIYQNFDEFKYNKPSLKFNPPYRLNGKNKKLYVIDEKSGKEIKVRRAWGFCDGQKIFYKHKKYNELKVLGLFSCYHERGTNWAYAPAFPLVLPIPIPYDADFLLNFNNGVATRFKRSTLRRILKSDPELFEKFKNDKESKFPLVEYLKLFNNRRFNRD
jgi:hypothetical protein